MEDPGVLSVGELTRQLKELVESNFPEVTVQGEISNLSRAGSGHVYLTLKDATAQIRGVIWRSVAERQRFELHDGLEVTATGPVELYAQRGSYQLIIRRIAPLGVGALELAFRQLQQKLAAEGLFEADRKRPLPHMPRRIALITSPTGAAVRDMLQVMTRRWPPADIVILPVPVQGDGAAERIAQALVDVASVPDVDVVIVGRGGGSLEDLWAFNEEVVARAIVACPIPVISAVGHEIDVSISDLVADRRALTPSEAGELAVPSLKDIQAALQAVGHRLAGSLRQLLARARTQLEGLEHRRIWREPLEIVRARADRVDELERRMVVATRTRLERARRAVELYERTLDALSPLKVLARGYSLTVDAETGKVVDSVADVRPGQQLRTRLRDGQLLSSVQAIESDAKSAPSTPNAS